MLDNVHLSLNPCCARTRCLPLSLQFTIVAIMDATAGAAIFKSLQRMAGVVLAFAFGIFCQYTTYLLNGLSYDNTAVKCVVMTLLMAILGATVTACSVKHPKHFCECVLERRKAQSLALLRR